MTLPADDGFSAAVTEGHQYGRRVFLCTAFGRIVEQLPVDPSSSLQVSGNLVRRSGTLVIQNRDGRYTPASGGLIDFGVSFLWRYDVVRADGSTLSCDQPLLFPDSDEFDVGGRTVTIPVSDGMRIVGSDAQLSAPVTFTDGTALESVVRDILAACGAPEDDAFFDLDSGGQHLVGDHGYEVGVRWADMLNQLLADYSCDLWAAPPLVYTLRPIPDPLTQPVAATWQLGSQVRLLGLTVRRTTLARNHAIVDGIDPYGQPFTVELFDDNPSSPVRYGRPGVGDLSVYWKSDGITGPDQATRVARSLLVNRGVQRDYEASVPVDPSLDRRDVVRIIEPQTGTDVLAMLDSWTLPLAPGSQTEARSLE